ncbi:MAG TPA: FecR family protein [Candidatus Baltobacteraceae bacterium]|nr:FecR family protein [Candidatus Baltobacteraceae bacterium]
MNRRLGIVMAACAYALVVACALPSLAGDDKQLQNVKGSVSYQAPNKTPVPVGVNAIVGVNDQYTAITGNESLGAISLPDSSQVMVGSDSKVQLALFNQTNIANAKFVLYDGKVRFAVRHPQGAQANYTFTTATGSVAVRGTQGDISYDDKGNMRVNVYELCDKNLPVRVTFKNGQVLSVLAGQSLAAQLVNGIVRAQVQQLTQQLINQFSPEFGVPTSWDEAQGRVVAYAQTQVNSVTNQIPGSNLVPGGVNVGGLFGHKKSTPSPSPAPTPATCH